MHTKPTEASAPPRVQCPVEEAESSGNDSLALDSLALWSFFDVGNGSKVDLVLEPGVSSHRRLWGLHTLSKREPREAGRGQDRLALLGLQNSELHGNITSNTSWKELLQSSVAVRTSSVGKRFLI